MSYTETHIGRLRKIDLQGMPVEEFCTTVCVGLGIKKESYHDCYKDVLLEAFDRYIVVDEELYQIIENSSSEDDFISRLTKNSDGTYTFLMRFYNGGTCLTEMLEEAIMRRKNEDRQF